jgi:putative endonuclease
VSKGFHTGSADIDASRKLVVHPGTGLSAWVRGSKRLAQRDDLSHLPTREPPLPVSGNAFIYILACPDGAIYVGSAGDVAKRLAEHGGPKGAKFTRNHPGARLIYVEGPPSLTPALQRDSAQALELSQEIGPDSKSDRTFAATQQVSRGASG